MIQTASPSPGRPSQWIYCLPAYAELAHRLPLLYKIVEGSDVVRIELHLQTGAFEALWITRSGDDHVAASISLDLYRRSEQQQPSDRLSYAATKLDSDLQWAATRDCAEQGAELLVALTGFRGVMIELDL